MNDLQLTDLEQALLDILRNNPEWFTRQDLARAAGIKPRSFTHYYTSALQRLIDLRLVVMERKRIGLVKTVYVYKTAD